ncbi:MAG: zinc ribbon domain-containing protein [Defluviitaleaceae bacterium]|nr:zinc ribbon domain-containing protein [Defluviitaleaceae bacterium]
MENAKHCQSCYMPMGKDEDFGKEKDGSQNADYCQYCYVDGKFTSNETYEEAVESNIQFWKEEGDKSDDEARERIKAVFPTLKRWKVA